MVNIYQKPPRASIFGVTGLSTLILFKQSQEVQRLRGAAQKRVLASWQRALCRRLGAIVIGFKRVVPALIRYFHHYH